MEKSRRMKKSIIASFACSASHHRMRELDIFKCLIATMIRWKLIYFPQRVNLAQKWIAKNSANEASRWSSTSASISKHWRIVVWRHRSSLAIFARWFQAKRQQMASPGRPLWTMSRVKSCQASLTGSIHDFMHIFRRGIPFHRFSAICWVTQSAVLDSRG